MACVRTTIYLSKSVRAKTEGLARKMGIPRSRLIQIALKDYLSRLKNAELLAQIDAAYGGESSAEERLYREKARGFNARRIKNEW